MMLALNFKAALVIIGVLVVLTLVTDYIVVGTVTTVVGYASDEAEFTAVWVEIRWAAKFAHVEHRDLLGSLMALGMDRAFFGDLIALEDHAYLLALPEVADRLPVEWDKAGNVPIKVKVLVEAPYIEPPKGESLRDTVASLRLDCILSAGMKTSRSRAAEIIRTGAVAVDHTPEERTDRMLTAGQLLSIDQQEDWKINYQEET